VFALRDHASSLILAIAKKHAKSSQTLKPRLARTLLKTFLEPNKSFGAHYGAIKGLQGLVGAEGVRVLILPNLGVYDGLLKEGMADENRRPEAEMVVMVLLESLQLLAREVVDVRNGDSSGPGAADRVTERLGEVLGKRVLESNNARLVKAVLQADLGV